jgi:hypothetical protein
MLMFILICWERKILFCWLKSSLSEHKRIYKTAARNAQAFEQDEPNRRKTPSSNKSQKNQVKFTTNSLKSKEQLLRPAGR